MQTFSPGEYVVYPPHGVGKFLGSEEQNVGGQKIELLVILFEKEKMTLRLPGTKMQNAGLRHLSSLSDMQKALEKLSEKCRHKHSMWSRRAQEYETKINSGDLIAIAEVVRELFKDRADQSYSERQIYQSALDRLVGELSVVESIDESEALKKLEVLLKAA